VWDCIVENILCSSNLALSVYNLHFERTGQIKSKTGKLLGGPMGWFVRKFLSLSGKRNRRRGQSLVEFAILLPLLVLIVFGVLDLGRAFFALITITNAAREGARFAVLKLPLADGMSTSESDKIKLAAVAEILPTDLGIDPDSLHVTTACIPSPCASGSSLQVAVEAHYISIINTASMGVLFPNDITMRRAIQMVIP
jgi:hypothetical protein